MNTFTAGTKWFGFAWAEGVGWTLWVLRIPLTHLMRASN